MNYRIRLRPLLSIIASACVVALPSGPAGAQFAVIDVASVAQLIQQAQTLTQQLEQARAQVAQAQALYQSLTGTRGMQQLLSGTVRNYLPTDWTQLMSAALGNGGSYGVLSADVHAAINANAVLSASQIAALPASEQAQIATARSNVALLQALTREALSNSSNRFASIQQLVQAIPAATDQKGILDLQARIGAEQGMLQNEQTKLQTLYQTALSQVAMLQQQEREQIINAYGSFANRFRPSAY
jgi:type IV secretion system protein VirB5